MQNDNDSIATLEKLSNARYEICVSFFTKKP